MSLDAQCPARTGVDSLDEFGTMAGMSNRELVAWAVFDGPDRMHLAPGYGEAESCAEDIGGEIVPLYRAPRWIPASERLPEDRVRVLTCGDDPVEGPFMLIGYREPASKFGPADWHLPCFAVGPVTHWMPLPEPPEVK